MTLESTSSTIDFRQVRRHIEFDTDENKTVRDRLTVFTMPNTVKFIEHISLIHNFQNCFSGRYFINGML